jgi:hypothetical protein
MSEAVEPFQGSSSPLQSPGCTRGDAGYALRAINRMLLRSLKNNLSCEAKNSSRLTPHASRLTPHASRLTPHASRLTPHYSYRKASMGFSLDALKAG